MSKRKKLILAVKSPNKNLSRTGHETLFPVWSDETAPPSPIELSLIENCIRRSWTEIFTGQQRIPFFSGTNNPVKDQILCENGSEQITRRWLQHSDPKLRWDVFALLPSWNDLIMSNIPSRWFHRWKTKKTNNASKLFYSPFSGTLLAGHKGESKCEVWEKCTECGVVICSF